MFLKDKCERSIFYRELKWTKINTNEFSWTKMNNIWALMNVYGHY